MHMPDSRAAMLCVVCCVLCVVSQCFGWDYLRDNMANHPENTVQRGFHFAIVDEVDSVLIDESNTPLLISYSVENANPSSSALSARRIFGD